MRSYTSLLLLLQLAISFSQTQNQILDDLYANYYRTYENQTDSALVFIKQAHEIALELNDNNWLAKTSYGLGHCNFLKRNDSLSLNWTLKGIKYALKSNNQGILVESYRQIGRIYASKNDYKEALKYYYKSLQISQSDNKLNDYRVFVLTNLGDLHIVQNDTIRGLNYYYKAKSIGEKNKSLKLNDLYNNLGVLYMGSNIDSALFYLNKSLNIYQKNHNLYGEINSRINIATTYFNFSSKENYSKAFSQLQLAKKLAEQVRAPNELYYSNYFLGIYYEKVERDPATAISYYKKSLGLLKNGYKNEYAVELYKSLSRSSMKLGDYKTAYDYQVKFQTLQDSIFSVEKNKQFHEIQTKFEVEQKNNKIQLLDKENEIQSKQKLWIFISASILILFLTIIAYVYKKEARSQKIIRKKDLLLFEKEKETIDQQQKLNEIKFLIEGQNKERSRISKELHDGVASSVAAIKMNLALLNQNEIKNNRLELHVEQLNTVSKEIRIISHALSTGTDSDKSLLELIHDLIEIYQLNRKYEMNLTLFPEDCLTNLDEFLKINLYRIFQEAFANISKHSNASNIEISCTFHEKQLTIIIEDDGRGFESKNPHGIGLKNIEERVKELNGILKVDSNKNHGTTITVQVPTKHKNED